VYPPVDTDFYSPAGRASSSAFLVVSALVPYKRVDLAIEACRQADVPLKIVGTGPERSRLEAMSGSQVEFLGWQSDEQIRALYRSSAATLLPGVEDFGIVPVEAQACGCPVVALDAGGARETVLDGVTGILVQEPTAGAFATALSEVARRPFDEQAIRANALRFSRGHFLAAFRAEIEDALNEKWSAGNTPRVPPQSQKAARENGEAAARMSPPQPKAAREDKQ
jgi:glycosyltransferase involved in cell wall biosynthesis